MSVKPNGFFLSGLYWFGLIPQPPRVKLVRIVRRAALMLRRAWNNCGSYSFFDIVDVTVYFTAYFRISAYVMWSKRTVGILMIRVFFIRDVSFVFGSNWFIQLFVIIIINNNWILAIKSILTRFYIRLMNCS